ncbi:MAG: dihydrodipicolinate synthase family protein [Candidatus Thermoplasmatota archaeon]|nr:dihydrodipicolinate synthase family protein [Candidatus Thermoplasmatota archaeon]
MRPTVITPMVTPFNRDGSISAEMTETLLSSMSSWGVDGAFPLGTTGVFPWLRMDERRNFLELVSSKSVKMKLYAGISSPCLEDVISLADLSRDLGYNYAVILPPYYIRPGEEGVRSFFSRIFESTDIRFIVYNIPQYVGYQVPLKLLHSLAAEYSNFSGIKDSSGDMRYHERLNQIRNDDFSVYQGQDDLFTQSVLLGSEGGVCGTTNFMPHVVEMARLGRTCCRRALERRCLQFVPCNRASPDMKACLRTRLGTFQKQG